MPDHEHVVPFRTSDQQITKDLLDHFSRPGPSYWLAVVVLAVLLAAGVVGFILRLSAGFPNTPAWGYYAATFAYLLTTVMAAPIVPIGLYFTKALWTRPINRAAMLFAIPGILWGLMFLPLLGTLPPLQGRASIWFNAPIAALRWVDTIAVFALVVLGLVIVYVRSRPDWAVVRDQGSADEIGRAAWLARGWRGSQREWRIMHAGFTLLGAAYIFLFVYVTMLISIDFDMSLIPGWRSPIYPTYHLLTSAQAAIAVTLVTIALLRRFGGLGDYLGLSQFWALGKLQLALTLLWFYFFWSEFIVVWYGRTPREQTLMQIFDFGPYFVPFLLTAILAFLVPFLLLIWNPIRKSVVGPPIAALSILVGLFFDRIRLYVPAYTVAGVGGGAAAGQVPPARLPDLPDVLIVVGALSGAALLYLLATRLTPVISIWEMKAYLMLRETRQFLRRVVEVVGKPD